MSRQLSYDKPRVGLKRTWTHMQTFTDSEAWSQHLKVCREFSDKGQEYKGPELRRQVLCRGRHVFNGQPVAPGVLLVTAMLRRVLYHVRFPTIYDSSCAGTEYLLPNISACIACCSHSLFIMAESTPYSLALFVECRAVSYCKG
jgi:hypothetical protein